jgi:hypothetical protein
MYREATVMCSAKVHVFVNMKLCNTCGHQLYSVLPCMGVILGLHYTVLSSMWTHSYITA